MTPRAGQEEIIAVESLLPWKVFDISHRPFAGFFSMNPSVHREPDGTWLCLFRCADYAMPGGEIVRGPRAKPALVVTKNAVAALDPKTWRVIKTWQVNELDGQTRATHCANTGFEDIRLFRTDSGGLQGIAASLHLQRPLQRPNGSNPPEQVLLSFDEAFNVVEAHPIRGAWSSTPQKNWMPFEGAQEPMFLYSIDRGTIFTIDGPINGTAATAPVNAKPRNLGTTEVRVFKSPKAVSAGRVAPPTYSGARGGSQLLSVGDDLWLGVGHEMRFVHQKKFYWHSFFTVDGKGQLVARSRAVKLAQENIEFAAGMAHDGDRLMVSYGVDDGACRIAETSLDAVLASLRPLVAQSDDKPALQREESVSVSRVGQQPRAVAVAAGSPGAQRDAHPAPRMSGARLGALRTAVIAAAEPKSVVIGTGVPAGSTVQMSGGGGGAGPGGGGSGVHMTAGIVPNRPPGDALLAAAAELARQRKTGTPETVRDAWACVMQAVDAYGEAYIAATSKPPTPVHAGEQP